MPRTLLSLACLAGLAGLAAPASAGGLPPLASKLSPPRFLDETGTDMFLMSRVGGYTFSVRTTFHGPASDSDAIRIDLTQKGKVVASERCPLGAGSPGGVELQCTYEGKPIKAVGEVTANVIYIDDQAEKEYLLRQLQVTVGVFPWMDEKHYQVLQDDMLGTAFATHQMQDPTYKDTGDHQLVFSFWSTGKWAGDPSFRCTRDGTRLPDYETFRVGRTGDIDVDMLAGKQKRVYSWAVWRVTPDRLLWGTFQEVKKARNWSWEHDKAIQEGYAFLGDMPGAWACDLRSDGQVLRSFRFQVSAKGRVLPSAAQGAAGFPLLHPDVVHVDMRIPAKGHGETRFRPQAIRKSMRYGMPWPKHPAIDAFLKSLPPASGLPDPGKK